MDSGSQHIVFSYCETNPMVFSYFFFVRPGKDFTVSSFPVCDPARSGSRCTACSRNPVFSPDEARSFTVKTDVYTQSAVFTGSALRAFGSVSGLPFLIHLSVYQYHAVLISAAFEIGFNISHGKCTDPFIAFHFPKP